MLCAWVFSHVWLFATLWIVAHQAPLSVGILQARLSEWVAIPSSKGSFQPKDWNQVSQIAGRFFTNWATKEVKNTGVDSLCLLQRIFLTQELNWGFLHCRQLSYQGSPISAVQLNRSVVSDSLQPHGLQCARLPHPSPSPRVCSNSCPLSRWCHPVILSSVSPFSSCSQSFPASRSFYMSEYVVKECSQLKIKIIKQPTKEVRKKITNSS